MGGVNPSECKSLDVCGGKISLCTFTIMYTGERASSSGIFLCAFKGETVEKVACLLQKKGALT